MCFRNLDVKAKDIDEMELISRFMERAKQVVIECTKFSCIKNIVFTGNLADKEYKQSRERYHPWIQDQEELSESPG